MIITRCITITTLKRVPLTYSIYHQTFWDTYVLSTEQAMLDIKWSLQNSPQSLGASSLMEENNACVQLPVVWSDKVSWRTLLLFSLQVMSDSGFFSVRNLNYEVNTIIQVPALLGLDTTVEKILCHSIWWDCLRVTVQGHLGDRAGRRTGTSSWLSQGLWGLGAFYWCLMDRWELILSVRDTIGGWASRHQRLGGFVPVLLHRETLERSIR